MLLGVTPHFPFSVRIHMGLQIRSLLTYPGVGECRLTSQDGVGVSLTFLPWFCAFHKRPPEHLCAEPSQHLSVMLVFTTCVLSTSVVSRSSQPYGLKPTRLLHRILQARKLEDGCHAILQGIVPTHGSNTFLNVCCIGRRVLCH